MAPRRDYPTFMLPAEPPTWGAERQKKSYRERIKDWNQAITGDLNAFPYVVFVNYTAKIFAYGWFFINKIMNPDSALFGEENIKRFILYNICGDVLGLNSTGGPLGFRMKFFFVTWYNLLMPGSITCPLVPGVPAKRSVLQSLGYIAYVASLVTALRSPTIGIEQVGPPVALLALLTPFDLVTFNASRGEHYGYMLVCCLFPWKDALVGIRICQACLWFFAGTAKIGPWMKYVNAFMMPNSKFIAILGALGVPIKKLLYVDTPRDVNPSKLLAFLAQFAVLAEVSLGPLCLFAPTVGVPLAWAFHVYILSMTPFASVMEWNCYCLYMVQALFSPSGHTFDLGLSTAVPASGRGRNAVAAVAAGFPGYSLGGLRDALLEMDPRLQLFLLFVLFCVPIYGQLYPKQVPFLTAFRPYAGNWRFTWHIVDNRAKEKLRKLKCLEGIFVTENARLLWGGNPHFCDQFEDYFTGNMVFFPHFRPLIPMVEKLCQIKGWKVDDYTTLFNEIFLNAITGWTLGTGFYVRGAYFDAVTTTCGFLPGEMYVAVFEPHGLLDHTSEWHLVDITNPSVKIMHGKMPYAELEKMQPTELSLAAFERASVLGKKAR